MKKNLLEVGQNVEFVKAGNDEFGYLIEKNTYNAKIETDNNDGIKNIVDVPYKDIKAII